MNLDINAQYRLELLKMARELLNEEYINRRAEDHNKWVADCDVARSKNELRVPYPPFAPYPSETEIVAKAVTLYNFVKPVYVEEIEATPVEEEDPTEDKSEDTAEPVQEETATMAEEIPAPVILDPAGDDSVLKSNTTINTIMESPWKTYIMPTVAVPVPSDAAVETVPVPVVEPVTQVPDAPVISDITPILKKQYNMPQLPAVIKNSFQLWGTNTSKGN